MHKANTPTPTGCQTCCFKAFYAFVPVKVKFSFFWQIKMSFCILGCLRQIKIPNKGFHALKLYVDKTTLELFRESMKATNIITWLLIKALFKIKLTEPKAVLPWANHILLFVKYMYSICWSMSHSFFYIAEKGMWLILKCDFLVIFFFLH